ELVCARAEDVTDHRDLVRVDRVLADEAERARLLRLRPQRVQVAEARMDAVVRRLEAGLARGQNERGLGLDDGGGEPVRRGPLQSQVEAEVAGPEPEAAQARAGGGDRVDGRE